MATLTDTWKSAILRHRFNVISSVTSNIYIGLSSDEPLEDGSGVSEPPTSKGYARIKTNEGSGTSWEFVDLATGSTVQNAVEIEFPRSNTPWGTIQYATLHSAKSGGTLFAFGEFGSSVAVDSYDYFRFNVGDLLIQEGSYVKTYEDVAAGVSSKTNTGDSVHLGKYYIEVAAGISSKTKYYVTLTGGGFDFTDSGGFNFDDDGGFNWE